MERLTDCQREVLDFIKHYQRECQRPPTHREINARFGFSSLNAAAMYLRVLEAKGYIRRAYMGQRAIEIVREPEADRVPGFVPASVVGETLNQFGFGQALANVLKECAVIR